MHRIPLLIGDLLRHRAQISPLAAYWREDGETWSYGEMERAAAAIAHGLQAEGLAPGTMVGIAAAGGPWYAAIHYAVARAGLVLAHLNPRYAPPEMERAVARAGCSLLFADGPRAAALEPLRPALPGVGRWILLPGQGPAPDGWEALEPWCESHGGKPPGPPIEIDPEAPFQLLFTSGTTGEPKGALIGHGAKYRLGQTHALNMGLGFGDRVLSALPLYHHFAQWLLLVAVPLVGAEVVCLPRFDAAAYWEALESDGITHLPAVPAMLSRLLAADPGERYRAPALRNITYGGAPAPPRLIRRLRERFPHARLFQGFGQTETGYCLGLHDEDHGAQGGAHGGSIGKPDIRVDLRLVDEAGRDVTIREDGASEVGEIVARTPYVMHGYLNDAEATAEYFRHGPGWGRTGDLAWRDNEGFYHLAGRRQELIISGGVNVYPAEVERVLLEHPGVSEAAVLGLPHPDWGEAVTAAVILDDGANPGPEPGADSLATESLDAHCRARLADFKRPKQIHIVRDFPRTASGKVRKGDLRLQIEAYGHKG